MKPIRRWVRNEKASFIWDAVYGYTQELLTAADIIERPYRPPDFESVVQVADYYLGVIDG